MASPRNLPASLALAALVGCGGSGSIQNAAHLRFFDALKRTSSNNGLTNVRLTIGGQVFSAGSAGASYEYGQSLSDYGDAPSGSGTLSIVVSPYTDQSTTTVSLSSQTLVQGIHYTLVAYTSANATSTTAIAQKLILFTDVLAQTADTQYVRILDASPTVSPVYLRLYRSSDNTIVYQTFSSSSSSAGLTVGSSSGYQAITPTSTTDSESYVLHVYTDSGFSNDIGSGTVSLKVGSPATAVIYDSSATSTTQGVSIKSGTDTTSS